MSVSLCFCTSFKLASYIDSFNNNDKRINYYYQICYLVFPLGFHRSSALSATRIRHLISSCCTFESIVHLFLMVNNRSLLVRILTLRVFAVVLNHTCWCLTLGDQLKLCYLLHLNIQILNLNENGACHE